MSLDVHLSGTKTEPGNHCDTCQCKIEVNGYWSNITHNLNRMAGAAGIYKELWRPEEMGITKASQLIEPLTKGLKWLKENPDEASKHNAPNGWGTYDHFVPWVEDYLNACKERPDSTVSVSR